METEGSSTTPTLPQLKIHFNNILSTSVIFQCVQDVPNFCCVTAQSDLTTAEYVKTALQEAPC
jgi:hypothetical protein